MIRSWVALPFVILSASAGCSSEPVHVDFQSTATAEAPSWTTGPARKLVETKFVYVGIGEDSTPENAKIKSEAFALQNLANDCSLVPEETEIENQFGEIEGRLYRAFTQLSIEIDSCRQSKISRTESMIRAHAQKELTALLANYQRGYDTPEKEEEQPLDEVISIPTLARFYVFRQRLALTKQKIILAPDVLPPGSEYIPAAIRAITRFEDFHSEIRNVTQGFSGARPNAANHMPSALRQPLLGPK